MSDFEMHVVNLEPTVRRLSGAQRVIGEELTRGVDRATLLGERGSKQEITVLKAVDTGHLRRSITASRATFSGGVARGKWGTNVPYAEVVHEGRGAGKPMPPPGALLGWMRRHGIPWGRAPKRDGTGSPYYSNEFAVARKIGRDGIPGRPFMRNVRDRLRPRFRQEFEVARDRIVARLSGRS